MGFTYSVALFHVCIYRCNDSAYDELLCTNPWLDDSLQFLRDRDTPFYVSPRSPLILLILDDQAIINCGWPNELFHDYYLKLRRTLAGAGIPIAWSKSSALKSVNRV